MNDIASNFRWDTFFRRIISGYVIFILLLVREVRAHRAERVVAVLILAAIWTLLCYRWKRPKSN